MALRNVLAGLIVVATAAFVVGTAVERNSSGESGHHDKTVKVAPATGERAASGAAHSEAGDSPVAHAEEGAGGGATATAEDPHAELRPLGIDIEAWPFVALAAAASLGLAAAARLRPGLAPLLGGGCGDAARLRRARHPRGRASARHRQGGPSGAGRRHRHAARWGRGRGGRADFARVAPDTGPPGTAGTMPA
jgi:hypothetical protein